MQRYSYGPTSNSEPYSEERLSSIGTRKRVWTRWNSPKQSQIWPVCACYSPRSRSYSRSLDLVSEYHQYANAELDDDEYAGEEQLAEGGEEEEVYEEE